MRDSWGGPTDAGITSRIVGNLARNVGVTGSFRSLGEDWFFRAGNTLAMKIFRTCTGEFKSLELSYRLKIFCYVYVYPLRSQFSLSQFASRMVKISPKCRPVLQLPVEYLKYNRQ